MTKTANRYLYAIRTLGEKYLCVRSVDVAHYLGFSKASVSLAIRQMREQGLIQVETDGNLKFTDLGKSQAESISGRIAFFHRLLTDAGVETSLALQDALSFSWEMSEASYEAFRAMLPEAVGVRPAITWKKEK